MINSLSIEKKTNGQYVTLYLKGSVTTDSAAQLNEALQELDYAQLDLTIDMYEAEYITSAGLRTLLVARKKLTNDTMRVIGANDAVMDVFKVTGFDSLIRIEKAINVSELCRLSVAQILSIRVQSDPDRIAFYFEGRSYTWHEVDMGSHIIAHELAENGVRKGTHVGLSGPNSINWIMALFAIQKLGAIAALINPGLRPTELCELSRMADITHLCYAEVPGKTSFEEYRDAFFLAETAKFAFNISSGIDFVGQKETYSQIDEKYRELHNADDPAVIIFSSGSTGLPKAVLASSYSIISDIIPVFEALKYDGDDISLMFLPLFHIFGLMMNLFGSMFSRNASVIPESKSPDHIIDLIEKYNCTIFNTVPAMMLAVVASNNFKPERLKSLRLAILAGAATTPQQFTMFHELLPQVHFCSGYGMSENGIISVTLYEDTLEHITVTVGKPIGGMEVEVRDSAGKVLPIGEEGEICIRSNSLIVCYYKLPIENQPLDDEGWLASGDLGFMDEEGYIHLTGRIKDIIICGGENISPGEIANVLSTLPEVADVKVLGTPDEIKGEVVTACLVLKPEAVWDEQKVRDYADNYLAKFKLPVNYVIFEAFPILGSGKIDGPALKKLAIEKLKGG